MRKEKRWEDGRTERDWIEKEEVSKENSGRMSEEMGKRWKLGEERERREERKKNRVRLREGDQRWRERGGEMRREKER